jgi:hypothetical protein
MNIFHTQTEMTPVTSNKRAMTIMEASSSRTLIYSQTVRDDYSGHEDSDGYSDAEYEGRQFDFTPIRKSKGTFQHQDSDKYSEEEYEEDLEEILYEDTGGWSGVNQYKYSKYDNSEYDEDEEYVNSEYDDEEDQPLEQLQQQAEAELDKAYNEVFFDRYNFTLY